MASIIRNGNLFCTCCGGYLPMNLPAPIDVASKKMIDFSKLHEDCKQTYVEPVVDQEKSANEKAYWWWEYGEKGASSMTMWECLMKVPLSDIDINHPYDPDDFSRCYKLLKCVPEWNVRLGEVAALCPEWKALIDNWQKLAEMYEEQVATQKVNGMYQFMDKLIRP